MQIKKNVIANTGDIPFVVSLEDFPHGELDSIRKDDKYDIEFYRVAEGTQVVSYNEDTGLPEFRDVKFWSIHRGKQVEIVNLDDGRQIITDNDPRAVYGIATKGCDSAKPSRFTPSEAMDRGVMVPVSSSPIASCVEGMSYDFSDGLIKGSCSDSCVKLGFSLGQFIGLMAGDGWDDVEGNPYFSDNEGFNIKFIDSFMSEGPYHGFYSHGIAGLASNDSSRYGDTVKYRLNSGTSALGKRVKELVDGHRDDTTSGSANKRLPVWYQFAGKEFILGLVNGLIATDGTVCLSHGKDKPQLQISFSSTSLRLAREFKRCCQLLGVKASISFNKDTSGGNKSWLCGVSTVDAKSVGLLDRCCHDRKRDVFVNAEVRTGAQYVKNDTVPLPDGVAERLVHLVPSAQTCGVDEDKIGEAEMSRRRRFQSIAIGLRTIASSGRITRGLVRNIKELGDEIASRNEADYNAGTDVLSAVESRFSGLIESDAGGSRRGWKVEMPVNEADAVSAALSAAKPRSCDTWRSDVRKSVSALSIVRKKGFVTWGQLADMKELFGKYSSPNSELRDSDDLKALVAFAESDVSWSGISSVEKTGKVEIGYDLTVPGPDTFMSDDGVILSNTVNIHVPASDKAAKQAIEKMLPSKNLFSLTDLKSMRYRPEKEQISGLWALTMGKTRRPTRRFASKAEAIAAYRNGEIGPNDPVEISGN